MKGNKRWKREKECWSGRRSSEREDWGAKEEGTGARGVGGSDERK